MSGYSSPYAAFAQVELPIDPGVVLLDIGFTGTDNNHGAVLAIQALLTMTDLVSDPPDQRLAYGNSLADF